MTNLVDNEDAQERLASGEQPYAFEVSTDIASVGPSEIHRMRQASKNRLMRGA
jgi:hypothetical protein